MKHFLPTVMTTNTASTGGVRLSYAFAYEGMGRTDSCGNGRGNNHESLQSDLLAVGLLAVEQRAAEQKDRAVFMT